MPVARIAQAGVAAHRLETECLEAEAGSLVVGGAFVGYSKANTSERGVIGFDGDSEASGACRALGVSLNLRETSNCQPRTGTRGLTDRDVPPPEARGGGRGAMQRAGPKLVLSG